MAKKSTSVMESDESGEECLFEEYTDDKPSKIKNIVANESFKPPGKNKTKQALILNSSNESQTVTKSNIFDVTVRFLLFQIFL